MSPGWKHKLTAAQRFRMLAMALSRGECATIDDVIEAGIEREWITRAHTPEQCNKWRRGWIDQGVIEDVPRKSNQLNGRITFRWTPKYHAAFGLMRRHYGTKCVMKPKGMADWRAGQALGMVIFDGFTSNETARQWMAALGDQTAQRGGKTWKTTWKKTVSLLHKLDVVQSVYHAEERLRYYFPEDKIPMHDRNLMHHMLELIKEKPRTVAELSQIMSETRKKPVGFRLAMNVRGNLQGQGLCYTAAKGNQYVSSLVHYGPAPDEPVKEKEKPEPNTANAKQPMGAKCLTYARDERWDQIYSGEYVALDPIEMKAVRAMAVRCRDWRYGLRNRVGAHAKSLNDEPVRQLFAKERDDVREIRLSAMALWLSWQPEFQKATV